MNYDRLSKHLSLAFILISLIKSEGQTWGSFSYLDAPVSSYIECVAQPGTAEPPALFQTISKTSANFCDKQALPAWCQPGFRGTFLLANLPVLPDIWPPCQKIIAVMQKQHAWHQSSEEDASIRSSYLI